MASFNGRRCSFADELNDDTRPLGFMYFADELNDDTRPLGFMYLIAMHQSLLFLLTLY